MDKMRTSALIAALAMNLTTLAAHDVLLDTAPPAGVAQANVYVGCDGRRWQLLWDYVDSADYTGVEVESFAPGNDMYRREARVTLFSVSRGQRSSCAQVRVVYDSDCFAVGLMRGADGNVRVMAGDKDIETCGMAIFKGIPDSRIIFRPVSRYTALHRNSDIVGLVPLIRASFEAADSLFSYLRLSTDGYEGLWEYLDHDTPEGRVVPGGKYRVATVRNPGTGKYDIIYLSGAEVSAERWPGLSVKGTLAPTPFPDNFDLIWTDAFRTEIYDDETSATFSPDGALLSLNFPLFGATMRFRRVAL